MGKAFCYNILILTTHQVMLFTLAVIVNKVYPNVAAIDAVCLVLLYFILARDMLLYAMELSVFPFLDYLYSDLLKIPDSTVVDLCLIAVLHSLFVYLFCLILS